MLIFWSCALKTIIVNKRDCNFQPTHLTKTKWTVGEFMKPGKELIS